jgi:hypothetical protein
MSVGLPTRRLGTPSPWVFTPTGAVFAARAYRGREDTDRFLPMLQIRSRDSWSHIFVGALAVAFAAAPGAFAQKPDSASATTQAKPLPAPGTYRFTLVPDSSDDIRAAVNTTVQHMSFITRPIARGRLNKVNPTPQRVRIEVTRDTLAVAFDGGNPVITPLSGDTVSWTNSLTKEVDRTHATITGDTVAQTIAAHDGQRENAYVFTDTGTRLRMHVTVTSPRLPRPLTYTLLFRNAAP